MNLIKQIEILKKEEIFKVISKRIKELKLNNSTRNKVFSELCFCILTANSKAETAINIQKDLGFEGFSNLNHEELSKKIRKHKHRFHNNKAKYIIEARKYLNIKEIIEDILKRKDDNILERKDDNLEYYKNNIFEIREFIVKNIKGLGYKEASHFLRNIGYLDLAILDRHILNLMVQENLLEEKPVSLSKKTYLEIESKLFPLAEKLNLSMGELDFYMWYIKTGVVLK